MAAHILRVASRYLIVSRQLRDERAIVPWGDMFDGQEQIVRASKLARKKSSRIATSCC